MQWKEIKPEEYQYSTELVTRNLDVVSLIRLLSLIESERPIKVISQLALVDIHEHLASKQVELGGLLIGKIGELALNKGSTPIPLIFITKIARAQRHQSTRVSLRMETEVWNHASALLTSTERIVGWYHSHPNLGAFFSGTDRYTQSSFFRDPLAIGWVIDPIRNEHAVFIGPDSVETTARIVAVDNWEW